VSDLLSAPPDDSDTAARRRALWGLSVLVLAAVVIVSAMILFSGKPGGSGHHGLTDLLPTDTSSSPPRSSATPTHAPVSRAATPTRTPTRPKPTSTANPCPSAAPCAVPGDEGGAVAAVNAFRVGHGSKAVPGTVSANAQQCALRQGNGPTCVPHYSWQPIAVQDGPRVVGMIAARDSRWLLDPAMTSFSVGWGYQPGAGGAQGQYEFVILKVG
jgi:hypothetical protein